MKNSKQKRTKNIMRPDSLPHDIEKESKIDSLTIQGDTLTVAEMLQRLQSGMSLTKTDGVFLHDNDDEAHEDFDLEKVASLDLVDQDNLRDEAIEVQERFDEFKKRKKRSVEEVQKVEKEPEVSGEERTKEDDDKI